MIVVIGEILIDIFRDYQRIGGAPFNFAFHLKKLGFPVRFLTRVGDDRFGRRIVDHLQASGFDTADVQIDLRHPTGTVRVDLDRDGVPHFNICENVAYDYLDLNADDAPDTAGAQMIYFGTLLQRTEAGHRQVQRFLSRTSVQATRFCDVNLRPPHVNPDAVAGSLDQADLLKLNQDELADIRRLLGGPTATGDPIAWLMRQFAISAVALTRGSRGSIFYSRDATIGSPAVQGAAIVDTVGAGDGYAAILAAGYIRQLPWEAVLGQASRFAAQICGLAGAVPDNERFYDDFRSWMKGNAHGG